MCENQCLAITMHFMANNSLTQCRITMKFLHNFFNSFLEALANMVCEIKITSGSKKDCVKISW